MEKICQEKQTKTQSSEKTGQPEQAMKGQANTNRENNRHRSSGTSRTGGFARTVPAFLLFLTLLFTSASSCAPSSAIYREHALYNFSEEGFLASNLVQTFGSAPLTEESAGLSGARRACVQDALFEARRRMLTIFLHTHFSIESTGGPTSASAIQPGSFESDYPYTFSAPDYIRAEMNFQELLDSGFLALSDTRHRDRCFVIYRIIEKDIVSRIKSTEISFQPQGFENRSPLDWRKSYRKRDENLHYDPEDRFRIKEGVYPPDNKNPAPEEEE